MPPDDRIPPDPGVERAREATPNPARTEPAPPAAVTPADAAGERVRDEHPPDEAGIVTPAPPLVSGPDVNDVDRLEDGVDRFLGGPSGGAPTRR